MNFLHPSKLRRSSVRLSLLYHSNEISLLNWTTARGSFLRSVIFSQFHHEFSFPTSLKTAVTVNRAVFLSELKLYLSSSATIISSGMHSNLLLVIKWDRVSGSLRSHVNSMHIPLGNNGQQIFVRQFCILDFFFLTMFHTTNQAYEKNTPPRISFQYTYPLHFKTQQIPCVECKTL